MRIGIVVLVILATAIGIVAGVEGNLPAAFCAVGFLGMCLSDCNNIKLIDSQNQYITTLENFIEARRWKDGI